MGTLIVTPVLPSNLKSSSLKQENNSILVYRTRRRRGKKNHSIVPVARLFGPAIFEASKLKVLFLGVDEKKHPGKLPRTYTLTHSDITSKLTLAISQTINNSQLQGWYNRLQRDEVVAEWKKIKEKMSLHVHCHISGGHFLLDLCARLRFYIFSKELPVVLKAFVHGDESLFDNHPDLQEALVWEACNCCFPPMSLIPWAQNFSGESEIGGISLNGIQQKQQNFVSGDDEDYYLRSHVATTSVQLSLLRPLSSSFGVAVSPSSSRVL
ncbi:unnamed protein product [Fraxinus pennsylvanica]|uniref:Staygreen protein domain-containing protein n=1 Tax=Fraxinus pennsylvanica TaxID=56036 RepID=A0AAD2E2K0_9LAMI|nr:unnamed protein product [Fraxinus pennsylvanica]